MGDFVEVNRDLRLGCITSPVPSFAGDVPTFILYMCAVTWTTPARAAVAR